MTHLHAGYTLGRYELLVRIGQGGMASVWVARMRTDSGQLRYVAVKAMLPELAHHSEFRSMFLHEVQIVQRIDHPHVVRVYEVSEDHGVLYMVMEWVEGDSLNALIKQARVRGAIPADIGAQIVADAAAGLHAAHELRGWDGELLRVVHRDVSPHNILVSRDGKAKLVDFGIADAMGRVQDDGQVRGKIGYLSPEQSRGETLDRRSDVYSLGIVLYELVTGEKLFKGHDHRHTIELIQSATIPPPHVVRTDVPEALSAMVMQCLERDRDRRFASAEEMGLALKETLARSRVVVSHAGVASLLKRVVGGRMERRRELIDTVGQALDAERQGQPELSGTVQVMSEVGWQEASADSVLSSPISEAALGVAARVQWEVAAAPAPTASPRWPLVAVPLLLVALGAAGWFAWQRTHGQDTTLPSSAELTQPQAPKRPLSTTGGSAVDNGASIDSLPLVAPGDASAQPLVVGRPLRPGQPSSVGAPATPVPLAPPEAPAATATSVEVEPVVLAPVTPPPPPAEPPFNQAQATAALNLASAAASGCRTYGVPTGLGNGSITFTPEGVPVSVSVGSPFSGTEVGRCVTSHFRNIRLAPFSGEAKTLYFRFDIPK
jgi:hypothetical protein